MSVLRNLTNCVLRFRPSIQTAQYSRRVRHNIEATILPDPSNPLKTDNIIDLSETHARKRSELSAVKRKPKVHVKKIESDFSPPNSTVEDVEINDEFKPVTESISNTNNSGTDVSVVKLKGHKKIIRVNKYLCNAVASIPVFDSENNLIYQKLQNKDSDVAELLIKLKSQKERGRCGYFMVEGWRLIIDGLKSEATMKTLIFSDKDDLEKIKPFMPQKGVNLLKIPYREIQMWSSLDTSPGVIAVFQTPRISERKILDNTLPINIICDNIKDPGNLAAIMRLADGVGCQKIFLTTGCVDLWESKVIRGAAGAHFRMCIDYDLNWKNIIDLIPADSKIFIADSKVFTKDEPSILTFKNRLAISQGSKEEQYLSVPYYDVDYRKYESIFLVIGGESEGISNECYSSFLKRNIMRINIPMKMGVDSLNVGMALAVIVFEIKRQMQLSTNSDKDFIKLKV